MSSEAAPEVVSATASTTPAATPPLKGGGVPGGGGTTTAEQQQVPFQFSGCHLKRLQKSSRPRPPQQMIPPGHFFANPFMNPYVPSGVPQQQETGGEPSGVPQPNQMVFSPAQYQEVMHHYFQQMMAASGAQFPIPFPMQFQPAFQQPRPSSQVCSANASSSHRSEDDNGRQTAGSMGCVSSNVSPNHRETKPEGSKEASTSPETQEPVVSNSAEDTLVPTSSDVAVGDVISGEASPESTSSGEEKSEEKRKNSGDRTDSLIRKQMSEMEKEITRRSQNKNIKKSGLPYTAPAVVEKPAPKESLNQLRSSFNLPEDSPTVGPVGPAQNTVPAAQFANNSMFAGNFAQNAAFVQMTPQAPFGTTPGFQMMQPHQHTLFMQQPNLERGCSKCFCEILTKIDFCRFSLIFADKSSSFHAEIHILSGKKNQKIDNFLKISDFLSHFSTEQTFEKTTKISENWLKTKFPNKKILSPPQPRSTELARVTTFVNNGTNPFLQQQPPLPNFANGTTPLVPTVTAQQFTPEQLAAAFAQQQIAQQHMQAAPTPFDAPPPSTSSGTTTSSTGLAPPPPPSHPIHRKNSGSGWPEENKENGTSNTSTTSNGTPNGAPSTSSGTEDPVWVLRDSYLKKMQREQRTSEEEEMNWHEAATAAQEAAENGAGDEQEEQETDRLLNGAGGGPSSGIKGAPGTENRRGSMDKKKNSKETMVHEPAVLIEGVLFRARYLGSTQMLCESRGSKAARMAQAQEAVARVKAPDGDVQPSTEIDLFISTEKIMVLNTDLQRISDTDVRQDILMDHALRTISYIADIGDLVVLMARRMSTSHSDESCSDGDSSSGGVRKTPKVICHVFESDEASFIAQSIGQAFQVAYVEFLRANGIDDPSYLRQIDYQEVLNSQELLGDELEMFAKKETQKEVVVPKKAGEPLGIVVVESGWGSMLPTVVLAHMNPIGPAAHSNKLNIGDQIININGISLVGLPLSAAQTQIKNMKTATAVRMTVVSTPPVVEVRIRRPDTKYQLGFSVQNGVICSLLRGGIAERGGIRVGHRIIEINGTSVVAVAHDRIVNMLATAVGEIHMKTMPTSMFRLLTGQEQPQYI
ncbi:Protein CBR-LIN-10, isoform b [Caenorhabditis briggsae]|uniref:Protein CBR-LIN-10, isoform b n=1 Tax=Caenorhabditis briggsae TaxID=6238 RepID=H8WH48_CAEBR|nr:Protein CBR-LIN-10, isoform b [Caenorhabditis briggsae]CCG58565.1 Protein CBR-LIN-10, isoform b [Caenorhabditis briggsae]